MLYLTKFNKYNLLVSLLFLAYNSYAQDEVIYSAEKEALIQRIENNLIPPSADSSDITWSLTERMANYNIPAVSIAVIKDYQIDWARAYGWADKESQIPATTKTLFQAASISKSLNAVAVLNWVEENNVDLDTDINEHLNTWKLKSRKKAKGKKISLANILSHTGGLSGHGFNGYEIDKPLPSTEQILNGKKPANSKGIKSIFEPNKEFKYSGSAVMMTQLMLEQNTGAKYDVYIDNKVLKPLGMTESFFTQPPPKDAPLATAYWAQGIPLKGKYHIYPELATAGLWTTPTDLCKFIIEIQKSLIGQSNKLLTQKMTKRMLSPYLKDGNTGLGVFIEHLKNKTYFTHGGSNEGFKCYYYGSMEEGNGFVVMVNSENFDIFPEIVRSIFKEYKW